jgi:hypothetical protein
MRDMTNRSGSRGFSGYRMSCLANGDSSRAWFQGYRLVNLQACIGGGTVHIKYRDLDQLDEIMKRLAKGM